jgi:hypothetical protein
MAALPNADPTCVRLTLRFTRLADGTNTAASYYLLSRARMSAEHVVGRANVVTYLRAGEHGIHQYIPANPELDVPSSEVTIGFDIAAGKLQDARYLFVLWQTQHSYASDDGGPGEGFIMPWESTPLAGRESPDAAVDAVPIQPSPEVPRAPEEPALPWVPCREDGECVVAWRYYSQPREDPCRCDPRECPLVVHRDLISAEHCLALPGQPPPDGCHAAKPMTCKCFREEVRCSPPRCIGGACASVPQRGEGSTNRFVFRPAGVEEHLTAPKQPRAGPALIVAPSLRLPLGAELTAANRNASTAFRRRFFDWLLRD